LLLAYHVDEESAAFQTGMRPRFADVWQPLQGTLQKIRPALERGGDVCEACRRRSSTLGSFNCSNFFKTNERNLKMFKDKKVLISLAVAVFLAGCGGGGGGTPSTASTTTTTTTTTTTPPVTPPVVVVDESLMSGFLQLVGNQVLFNGIGITTDQFANAAATPKGAYGFAEGTNAPLQTFGLRVRPEEMAVEAGQSKTARLAIELKDRAVGGLQTMQLMIDQVTISVSATNQLTVSVPATAKMYVYINNAGGQNATVTVPNLAADLVQLTTIDGDASSHGLSLNLDAAITAAINAAQGDTAKLTVLNSLKDFIGEFDMNATVSNVVLQKTDGTALAGASITVTGSEQPAVNGAGVKGIINLE
jgi:hypothetical protein